jgi:magnesium-transporting ATPase (P-type)
MNTRSANQKEPQVDIEQRLRTMRTLWIAMFSSLGVYYVFTFFVERSQAITPNRTLSLVLVGVALLTTLISFPIKNKLLTRAAEQQQVQLVQQGYIVAWAITEVAALLGLLDFFLTGNRYYYLLFIIAACGLLLHAPRREHVMNAGFKSTTLL